MTTVPGRIVLFRLAGERLAFDLATVSEVSELPVTYPIPMAPPYFRGVMNSHGSLVSLLDLARFLGKGSGRKEGKVLGLDRRLADLAFWVDDVERIILAEGVISEREGDGPYLERFLTIDDGEVGLLSTSGLVAALESDMQEIVNTPHAG